MGVLTKQEIDTLTCEICGKVAKSLPSLRIHKGMAHKEELKESGYVSPKEKALLAKQRKEERKAQKELLNSSVSAPVEPVSAPVEPVATPVEPVATPVEPVATPVEPVATPVEPKSDLLNPKDLGIKEILEGSRLKLRGLHWSYVTEEDGTISQAWEQAEDILVVVNLRWLDAITGSIHLKARSEGGSQEWILKEEDVLESKNVDLLSLSKKEIPANYIPQVPPPAEDSPPPGPSEEEIKEKEAYLEALNAYVEARDSKLNAEKAFKNVSSDTRQQILEYVEKYGTESVEGKGDNVLLLGGHKVHWTLTEGESYTKRDEEAIFKYLWDNGLVMGIKFVVDWDMWEKLKENGVIPPNVIQEVEEPAVHPDVRKLLIEPEAKVSE